MKSPELYAEIFGTALNDGEQTPGGSFTSGEKPDIAGMLRRLKVDRMEIGSAGVSGGEAEGVRKIIDWSSIHEPGKRFSTF